MTTTTSPIAEEKLDSDTTKAEDIQTELTSSLEILNEILDFHEEACLLEDVIKNERIGIQTGPWKNIAKSSQHIFDFFYVEPCLKILKSNSITIYSEVLHLDYASLKLEEVKTLFNTAQTNITDLSIKIYQDSINNIVTILSDLLNRVNSNNSVYAIINNEITNTNSSLYSGAAAFGPFSPNEIRSFVLPSQAFEVTAINRKLINKYSNLIEKLGKLGSISEDVLSRISLSNVNLTQDSSDSNLLNVDSIEEKDPWGIRFSYTKSVSGATYIDQINTNNGARANRTLTHDNQTREEVESSFIETPENLANKTVNQKRDFYFQLLPAIKSNLPVSAGTDVPGAMPGIQFRIENNIVKHKIPGFSPIYQPIGIDSIKCTLVGMFSGNDGVDISSAYSDDLNTGLLLPNKDAAFGNRDMTNKFVDGTNTPIPAQSKSTTSSNVAILAEDAFRSAQDFYNEIVATGQEIEVELNMRKSSGPFPGGTPGPFRDEVTGNPKFKALIKKLDLYYVRRDRCWFILDLEITNSGLISKKCINLTNIIDQAVDLFEAVEEEPTGLTNKIDLDKCFKNPIELKYKNDKSGYTLVIDKATGLSYEYKTDTNILSTEDTYPTSTRETLKKLRTNVANFSFPGGIDGTLGNRKKIILAHIVDIFINNTLEISTNKSDTNFNFAPNRLVIKEGAGYLAYDKNSGLFYVQDKKTNIEGAVGLFNLVSTKDYNKKTLKQLAESTAILNTFRIQDASFGTVEIDEALRFFLDDYLPLVSFRIVSCDNKQQISDIKKETTTSSNNPTNSNDNIPLEEIPTTTENFLNELQASLNIGDSTGTSYIIYDNLDYIAMLLQGKQLNVTTSVLTNNLVNVIKRDFADKKIFIKDTNILKNIEFSKGEENIQVIKSSSSLKEVVIKVSYDVNEPFVLIYNKKEGPIYPNSTSPFLRLSGIKKIATLKLKFSDLNLNKFEINSVNLVG